MIFDGATERLNLELETETGEPSDQVLKWGTHQPNRRVANRRKRTCALEACTKGRKTVRHLKPGQTDPPGLPAGSKGETGKESKEERKSECGYWGCANLIRAMST